MQGNIEHYAAAVFRHRAEGEPATLERVAHYDLLTMPIDYCLETALGSHSSNRRRGMHWRLSSSIWMDSRRSTTSRPRNRRQVAVRLVGRMAQVLREGDTSPVLVVMSCRYSARPAGYFRRLPILDRLIEVAAQPIPIGDALCEVSASIGVSYYPQGEDIDADQLLQQADRAMSRQQAGKNRYHVFDTEKDRTLRTRHEGFDSMKYALGSSFALPT